MPPSSSSARKPTGNGGEMQVQRSTSRETGQSQRSSFVDPDSSFASSNGSHTKGREESGGALDGRVTAAAPTPSQPPPTSATMEKLGGLGALGAKMRSFSSGARKVSAKESERNSYSTTSQLRASASRTSFKEDGGKKAKRASRILDAFSSSGGGRKSDVPFVAAEVPAPSTPATTELPKNEAAAKADQRASSARRRKLSDHILRASAHNHNNSNNTTPTSTPAPQMSPSESGGGGGGVGNTSQSDFNLRSFRNVRRQSSYFSYNVPVGADHAEASSSSPRSSAAYYATHSPVALSREESYMSAQESFSPGTSPRLEETYLYSDTGSPPIHPLHMDSKASSPRLEATRVMHGGSMSAGKFRRASSSRLLEEIMNHPNFNTGEDTGRGSDRHPFMNADVLSKRPASPFLKYTGSPSETLAALEAGRRTPLMFLHQAGAELEKKQEPEPVMPETITQAQQGQASQSDDEEEETALPYRQFPPSRLHASTNQALDNRQGKFPSVSIDPPTYDLSPPSALFESHHASQPFSASPDEEGDAELRASPEPAEDTPSLDHEHGATKTEAQRRIDESKEALEGNERRHQRGMSMPAEFNNHLLPFLGRRRLPSSPVVQPSANSSLQSRAQELLSFHHKHVPALSAAHTRTEIQSTLIDRIAWPTPPCVKVEYFSQLPAMHQHSLYEQHRKAADHALAEYMRLMAGVAPPEAMIQPESIFSSDSTLGRNASTASRRHPRSRSISVPGVHGGHLNGRRRSSALAQTTEPVPPMPTSDVIEQLETRALSGSQSGHSQERAKSHQPSNSPPTSPIDSHDTSMDRPYPLPRRPSARFMNPRHDSRAPIEALDGRSSVSAGTSTEGTDSLRRRSAAAGGNTT